MTTGRRGGCRGGASMKCCLSSGNWRAIGAVRAAAEAAGIPWCDDPNGAEQDGISMMESTVGGGRRSSSARAYLRPAMRRANLAVETGALVTRVVMRGGRAIGVE